MNAATHTPGPWVVKATGAGGFEILDMPDCWDASVLCARYPWEEKRGEMIANAHLIAAAPDLLAASRLILSSFAYRAGGGPEWYEAARLVVARATGEEA